MTDDMAEMLVPNPGDFRRARSFVSAWATADFDAMLANVNEADGVGRSIQFCGAMAEMLTRGYELRDNPEALAQWRADIAKHAMDEREGR